SCRETITELALIGQLDVGEVYDWGSNVDFSIRAQFVIKGFDLDENEVFQYDLSFNVNKDVPRQKFYENITTDLSKLRVISIEPKENTYFAENVPDLSKIRLVFKYEDKRSIDVSNAVLNAVSPVNNDIDNQWEQTFTWELANDDFCLQVPNYQFQLLKIYNAEAPDWSRALNVFTESSQTQMNLVIGEGSGTYRWRVRPVGSLNGDLTNIANLNENWAEASFIYENEDQNRNWIFSRTFSEGNKTNEQLTFANGLQQVKQQQTKIDDRVIATETAQDYVGRSVVSSLPVPLLGGQNRFGYKSTGIIADDQTFTAKDFDIDPKNPTILFNSYYSGVDVFENQLDGPVNEGVPSAEGFPYSRTLFLNDGTGRVQEESGVGITHSIGQRSIRTYYSSTPEAELLMLFGKDAPEASNVQKITTIDANNVASISYQNKDGKILATALSQGAENQALLPLESRSPKTIFEKIEGGSQLGEFLVTTNKPLFFPEDTRINVGYDITPSVIDEICEANCTTCNYEVQIILHRDEPKIDEIQVEVLGSISIMAEDVCTIENKKIEEAMFFDAWAERSYVLEKRVITNNSQYLASKTSLYKDQLDQVLSEIQAELDAGNIIELYNHLQSTYGCLASNGFCEITLSCEQLDLLYSRVDNEDFESICVADLNDNPGCGVSITIPMPAICETEPVQSGLSCTLEGMTFSQYFDFVYQGNLEIRFQNTLFFKNRINNSKSYFSAADFDAMMTNLLTDESELISCSELWYLWKDLVEGFEIWSDINLDQFGEGSTGFDNNGNELTYPFEYSLYENLINQIEATIQSKYIPDNPEEDPPFCPEKGGVKYFTARNVLYGRIEDNIIQPDLTRSYALAFYDQSNVDLVKYLSDELNINDLTLAKFNGQADLAAGRRITACEQLQISTIGQYFNVAEYDIDNDDLKDRYRQTTIDNCGQACELKTEQFRQSIFDDLFHQNENYRIQHYVVTPISYYDEALEQDVTKYIGYKDLSVNTEVYDFQECEIESMVEALVDHCKSYCILDWVDPVTKLQLGTPEQLGDFASVFKNMFDVKVVDENSCENDYKFIDVDNFLGGIVGGTGFTVGGIQDERITDAFVDGDYIYLTGTFGATVDFDPFIGSTPLTANNGDVFVAKYTLSGNLVWAQKYGDAQYEYNSRITDDTNGNLYLTYAIAASIGAVIEEGEETPQSAPNASPFDRIIGTKVLRLDEDNGNVEWTKDYEVLGAFGYSIPMDIYASESKGVIVTGNFKGNLSVVGSNVSSSPSRDQDIFIIVHDLFDGNTRHNQRLTGDGNNSVQEMKVNRRGDVLFTGQFTEEIDLDATAGVFRLNSDPENGQESFIARLGVTGFTGVIFRAGYKLEGAGTITTGIESNDVNDFYVIGNNAGNIDFDILDGESLSVQNDGIFICKYTIDGELLWVNELADLSEVKDIALNESEHVFITGEFSGVADLDPGRSEFEIRGSGISNDVYTAMYDPSGKILNGYPLNGNGSVDLGVKVLPITRGRHITVGDFSGLFDIDPTIGTTEFNSRGRADFFATIVEDNVRLNLCGTFKNLCFKWTDPFEYPNPDFAYDPKLKDCRELEIASIQNSLDIQKAELINIYRDTLEARYANFCIGADKLNENFTIDYETGLHHFTLYYYDRASNLINTVPPEGVRFISVKDETDRVAAKGKETSHQLLTSYQYNSLGNLTLQHSPDGDTTLFWYNDIGQLRFSQNGKQKEEQTFSYTKYDRLGRIIEVGQSDNFDEASIMRSVNDLGYPESGTQKNISVYSEVISTSLPDGLVQRNLRNRVSYTYLDHDGDGSTIDDQTMTIYSYDPHGNVEWLVQSIPGLDVPKVIRYEYDLVSGNVLSVSYNPGHEDQFYHRYTYDSDNRIVSAETSDNGYLWDMDAQYKYYVHGPLKNTVIGSDKVQKTDYLYTIQGWIKSINSPVANGTGQQTASDVFAMTLNYFNGDYTRNNSNAGDMTVTDDKSLYNGNISALEFATLSSDKEWIRTGYRYTYDELNRIRESKFNVGREVGENVNFYSRNGFLSDFKLDGNGNLEQLNRFDIDANQFDQMTYHLQNGKNRLDYVTDSIFNSELHVADIESQAAGNYEYDSIGNLTRDVGERMSIDWTVYGKVHSLSEESVANSKAEIFPL
ncbi:MAG: hypothetical protein AAFQ94_27165, partial [Bacteroidota bacterium]